MRVRVEHLEQPIGIGDRRPRLSWQLPEGATRQVAYELRLDDGTSTGRMEVARKRARRLARRAIDLSRATGGPGTRVDRPRCQALVTHSQLNLVVKIVVMNRPAQARAGAFTTIFTSLLTNSPFKYRVQP